MEMKVEIVSRETIKPFSPTPPELKTCLLSSLDQPSHHHFYMMKVYFYNNKNNNSEFIFSEVLKKSLSKTLVPYYPFAGRLSNGSISAIDCNDEGVSFIEAKILNCVPMSEIISHLKTKCVYDGIFELLFSDNLQGKDQRFNPLLSVQLTHFDCGGIAVAIFMSHKIADITTFVNFMNDWASIARRGDNDNDNDFSVYPRFDAASFFPAEDEQPAETDDSAKEKKQEGGEEVATACKRFEFDASQIGKLKGIVGEKVDNPTRVEVVTALIYKAITNFKNQPSILMTMLNLRRKIIPPLPDSLTGNILSVFFWLSTTEEQKEIELWKLVADMKKNLESFCSKYPRKYKKPGDWSSLNKSSDKEMMEWSINHPDSTMYICNSWCRLPIYEVDFGSGKPVWFTIPTSTNFRKNLILLMDTKDEDGIEVLVSLDSKEMPEFERNIQDLFCNFNI